MRFGERARAANRLLVSTNLPWRVLESGLHRVPLRCGNGGARKCRTEGLVDAACFLESAATPMSQVLALVVGGAENPVLRLTSVTQRGQRSLGGLEGCDDKESTLKQTEMEEGEWDFLGCVLKAWRLHVLKRLFQESQAKTRAKRILLHSLRQSFRAWRQLVQDSVSLRRKEIEKQLHLREVRAKADRLLRKHNVARLGHLFRSWRTRNATLRSVRLLQQNQVRKCISQVLQAWQKYAAEMTKAAVNLKTFRDASDRRLTCKCIESWRKALNTEVKRTRKMEKVMAKYASSKLGEKVLRHWNEYAACRSQGRRLLLKAMEKCAQMVDRVLTENLLKGILREWNACSRERI
ncbi:hypothetical protein CBR_g51054 [Chara braunii]|uniref:Sfi1 spindle body domain-containing protein n=1 Tax=Chara braunii TaxID=69332 RepID=A0A388K5X9_CHABU|nr:hypothetical protein CBR_g51054 [Chara braunii]|eukprot:GBG65460.1 hypothetical protein CBR_g51054 [Chara braunii]